jgi:hypothetical protein
VEKCRKNVVNLYDNTYLSVKENYRNTVLNYLSRHYDIDDDVNFKSTTFSDCCFNAFIRVYECKVKDFDPEMIFYMFFYNVLFLDKTDLNDSKLIKKEQDFFNNIKLEWID